MTLRRFTRHLGAPLAILALTALALPRVATAFQGPYASTVIGAGGYVLDLDVRWPDGPPPPDGWPVVFWGHGAGGDKTSLAGNAAGYANDGYVTLTWTNRSTATDPSPETLAADIVALKAWLVNDFQAEAGVVVPVDPARFGMTGGSLGGYTSWSGGLMSDAFATIVPFGWGAHFFREGVALNGSIDRQTGGPRAATFPSPYDAATLEAAFEAAFASFLDTFATVSIPVMTQMGMLDARTGGTYALHDYQALASVPAKLLYVGTGGHGTPDSDSDFRRDLRDRWFAHYLKGETNGIDAELPIQVALLGTNEHLAYADWPPPGQDFATVWLRTGGVLAASSPSEGSAAPAQIVNDPGTLTWAAAAPNFNPTTIRNGVSKSTAAWQTEPLTAEVLLIGEPSVRLELSGTGSRYQVNVHLYDVLDGGDPLLLSTTTATLGVSPAVLDVPMGLTARRIPVGHRLRLEITNRDDQDVDPTDAFSPQTGALRTIPFFEDSTTSIFQDPVRPSSLTVPLIGRSSLPLPGVCDPAPRAGCRQPGAASPLALRNDVADTRDSLTWRWNRGAATTFAELGDPVTDDPYAFCLYDGTGALVLDAVAPPGDLCGTRPCWKTVGPASGPRGWLYADRYLTPDGVSRLQVTAGDAGKAKATVAAKGSTLGAPSLPLTLPVRAQLQTTGVCFEASYASAQANGPVTFRAK